MIKQQLIAIFTSFILIVTLSFQSHYVFAEEQENEEIIIEENIEIFRLSMFLTDYEALEENSKLFLCINENEEKEKNIVSSFLEYKYEFNNTIGFEVASEKEVPIIDTLTKYFIDFDPYNYPFSEYLISLQRSFFYK